MRDSALAAFVPFLLACGEGIADWFYLDQHTPNPIVTTAVGCALFTIDAALALDCIHQDGSPASDDDVRRAWIAVNARPDLAPKGGNAFRELTTVRLTKASVDGLVSQKIAQFEAQLRPHFPGYDDAPDKAQEGLLRLAWATGAAAFVEMWPRFTAAFNAQQWAVCAKECAITSIEKAEPRANDLEAALFQSLADAA